jgi:hypothetical protein
MRPSSLHRRMCQLLAVGCDDLKVMDSDFLAVDVSPHDFLVTSYFKQLRGMAVCAAGGVAGDDYVAVGENLTTAWVL